MALGDDGAARHLVPGQELPDLELPSSLGGTVNLARQEGVAIVYVYPWTGRPGVSDPPGWDDIPGAHGSTPETGGFRDHYPEFRRVGVEVYGLSTQDGDHQRELAERLSVPFALLSDDQLAFQKALSLPTFETGGVPYLRRLTLFIRDGKIARVFYPVAQPETHAGDLLDRLTASRAT